VTAAPYAAKPVMTPGATSAQYRLSSAVEGARPLLGKYSSPVKRAAIALGLACALVLPACSGGGESNSSPSLAVPASIGATMSSSFPAGTQPAETPDPAKYLLAVGDMPTGWAIDNSSSDDSGGPPCLAALKKSFAPTNKANVTFAFQTSTPQLVDSVGTYADEGAASAAFDRGAVILDGCKDVSYTNGGKKVTGSIGAMSFPTVGDRSKAWALTLDMSGISAGVDVVLYLKGSVVEELALLDLGSPSADDLKTFSDKSVAKFS
jgi:hypothetical protein